MKRTIEQMIADVRCLKATGASTAQAMAATLTDAEWDDLLELIEDWVFADVPGEDR